MVRGAMSSYREFTQTQSAYCHSAGQTGVLMLTTATTPDGRTRRLTIVCNDAGGWDIREELDREVVREVNCRDWHRVERFLQVFELEDHRERAS